MESAPTHCKKVFWEDVREKVLSVNKELAEIIDVISPNKQYPLYLTQVPYGYEVVSKGKFNLFNANNQWVPITHHTIDDQTRELLGYNYYSNPVCLVLKKQLEITFTLPDRVISFFGMAPEGSLLGTWVILSSGGSFHPKFLWDITTGSRSIFMLSKISESISFKRMRKDYMLNTEPPQNMQDHWLVFRQLANSKSFSEPWCSELLLFSKPWFESFNDMKWQRFQNYLYSNAWGGSEYLRNKIVWDLIFSVIKQKLNLKVSAYIDNFAKHLLSVATGGAPGFAPAINSEAAPIHGIHDAFIESYRIKHPPILMQPVRITSPSHKFVYASLQMPNPLEFSIKQSVCASTIAEQYEVKSLLNKYIDGLLNMELNIDNTEYYERIKNTAFDYFHMTPEQYYGIRNSEEILSEDPSFLFGHENKNFKIGFPKKSKFLCGCVRISNF